MIINLEEFNKEASEISKDLILRMVEIFLKNHYDHLKDIDIKWDDSLKKYIVSCESNVRFLKGDKLTNDSFIWGNVRGYFNCSFCEELSSLEGAPRRVLGSFLCRGCIELKSLQGLPGKIGGLIDYNECPHIKELSSHSNNI